MLVKAAGFESSKQISEKAVLNFAYILYLSLLDLPPDERGGLVQKWLVMSILTDCYSSSTESRIDKDIRELSEGTMSSSGERVRNYLKTIENEKLSEAFWDVSLVQNLEKKRFNVFLAAQVHDDDYAFLSRTIGMRQLLQGQGDLHHLFPKQYLKAKGIVDLKKYNQLANFASTDSEVNKAISNKPPSVYMKDVKQAIQKQDKTSPYSSIATMEALEDNLKQHCIPRNFSELTHEDYEEFLVERRKLIAQRIKKYYFDL